MHMTINPVSIRTLICTLVFFMLLPLRQAVAAWEPVPETTSTPLHEGLPLQAQFRYHLIDFSPAGRRRDIRFKAGMFNTYSLDDMNAVAMRLMTKFDGLDAARLPSSKPGNPVYFANNRFFLVSVKPAVLVIVPHVFIPEGAQFADQRINRLNPQGLYNRLLEKERQETGLHTFLASLREPFWFNYVELSAVVPSVEGTRVIGDWCDGPVALEAAQEDPRWPFRVAPSARFEGYLEFTGRTPAQ